jgi:uncharacterized membrane protein YhhN
VGHELTYFAIITAVCVVLLLDRERRGDRFGQALLKLMASTAFIGCSLAAGALLSPFGRWVLVALAFSWIGDACLLSRQRKPFLVGLVAFLLTHVAYAAAFLVLGIDRGAALAAGVVVAVVGLTVGLCHLPKVETQMRFPVASYLFVISVMVTLGYAAMKAALLNGVPTTIAAILLIAPLGFYLSDLAVARDRFVKHGFVNRVWGLPLYYGAQILFAITPGLL